MSTTINGSAGVVTNSGAVYDSLQRGTAVSASGTSVDFTGIPSWVKRITVMFNGVSLSGTSAILVQLGDSGGIETTGYASASYGSGTDLFSSAGFVMRVALAADLVSGSMIITSMGSNIWLAQHGAVRAGNNTALAGGGGKTLSDTLTQLRITTVNGTDTFDAGSVNIIYEG
jgi:hypothetical protein